MHIETGKKYKFHQIINSLVDLGYHRVPLVLNPGDYSVRGSIIDVFPGNQNLPIRIELFDDEIEEIRTFEPNSQHSISIIKDTTILVLEEDHIHKAYVIPHEILFNLQIGDPVVHIHHGIGTYRGLERMKIQEFEGEYAVVEYQESDKIFIPIEQLTRIYKYTGASAPEINSLRDDKWQKVKKRVSKAVKNVAKDLFHLYKTRKIKTGFPFTEETELDLELDRTFPYKLTDDQTKAIEDVKKDMESTRAMDRLICGDVGFGKTEVAIRAAFKAVMSKKQVAILTPTTLLSKQHFKVFNERFSEFGIIVEYLNRFKTRKQQKETLERMKTGRVDVLIGTHRLLQDDVEFKDLGLLIIDEEQRFGVMAKEKIKQIKTNVDVLTLSATPLPRTLYLSISGIRDISVINTPPLKRLPIVTEYHLFDMDFIKQKIEFELTRGGQIFILHNRIHDIIHLQNKIKTMLPNVEVHIAHGRMHSRELEQLMIDFYDNKYSVLLSTTIIENGIDIPNVHTIIVDDAERFGLAQLHQLRGRVGRDETQSYAYLLYRHEGILTPEVLDRFEALIQFTTLGSGYDISLRDLELRGIGNILGTEQSGYMEAVGFELYMHLLNEAIAREKGQFIERKGLLNLSNKTAAYIPEDYIPDMTIRLALYKQIAEIETLSDVFQLKMDCEDRYGPLPENLYVMMEVIKDSLDKG
ncbi:MAG: transcription-repair coupling factor [Candidatus Margulisbacteria bacterium GWF2_35_9]|nr:MAG: transcription-repair coupling factor [Candidatus Margulisbacteria bacterium GWF2_35_9]